MLLLPTNEVWGKVIFSEACVKNSVHSGGGGSGSVHAGILPSRTWQAHPWDQAPEGPGIPPQASPPPTRPGRHPLCSRACWEIRYWNAILLFYLYFSHLSFLFTRLRNNLVMNLTRLIPLF